MIQDPSAELVRLVQRAGDEPRPSDRAAVALVRRRFGLALPPPFAEPVAQASDGSLDIPIRAASAADGPAIAAVKWRSWRVGYRGVVSDDLLDHLGVVPPAAAWTALAAAPPNSTTVLLVAGRPGEVHAFCALGPTEDADLDPARTGQIRPVYVDPSLYRQGIGARLVAEALDRLGRLGFTGARLWVIDRNQRARRFYEALNWEPDGATARREFTGLTTDEVRYRFGGPLG